jgi:hypothetical protein
VESVFSSTGPADLLISTSLNYDSNGVTVVGQVFEVYTLYGTKFVIKRTFNDDFGFGVPWTPNPEMPATTNLGDVPIFGSGGTWVTTPSDTVPTANALVRRDASGRAQVATPSVDADIATKQYADLHVKLPAFGWVQGALLVRGGSTSSAITPPTTDGYVLTADLVQGSRMKWAKPAPAPWSVQEWNGTAITVDTSYIGRAYMLNAAGPITVTVPSTGIPTGSQVVFIQNADGPVTFLAGSGAVLKAPGGKTKLAGLYSKATLTKLNYEHWLIEGDLIVP